MIDRHKKIIRTVRKILTEGLGRKVPPPGQSRASSFIVSDCRDLGGLGGPFFRVCFGVLKCLGLFFWGVTALGSLGFFFAGGGGGVNEGLPSVRGSCRGEA